MTCKTTTQFHWPSPNLGSRQEKNAFCLLLCSKGSRFMPRPDPLPQPLPTGSRTECSCGIKKKNMYFLRENQQRSRVSFSPPLFFQEDMVCLSCTGTGERVCLSAEGFGNRQCFLEGIADRVRKKMWSSSWQSGFPTITTVCETK